MIELEIQGKPIGKARPRLGRFRTYTPSKTKNYEENVQTLFKMKYPKAKVLDCSLEARITAVFEVPKSYSKKKRHELLNEKTEYTKKPDADNIAKIVLDSLNGLAYKDDSQVCRLVVDKIYGEQEKVIVKIKPFFK